MRLQIQPRIGFNSMNWELRGIGNWNSTYVKGRNAQFEWKSLHWPKFCLLQQRKKGISDGGLGFHLLGKKWGSREGGVESDSDLVVELTFAFNQREKEEEKKGSTNILEKVEIINTTIMFTLYILIW